MAEANEKGGPNKDVRKAIVGVFVAEIDLKEDKNNEFKKIISASINRNRPEKYNLEPTMLLVVRGGDEQTREVNLRILETACKAAMFDLCFGGGSETRNFMREHPDFGPPFVFRQINGIQVLRGDDKKPLSRSGIAMCSTGGFESEKEGSENELIAELGLILTEMNARSLYPRSWEGRQAVTLRTAKKG